MHPPIDADAVVVGGGPAGAAAAIVLARAGWRVCVVEQHAYPRRKVCGECLSAANVAVLHALGVGPEFERLAGPELREAAWFERERTVVAPLPESHSGPRRYGRALGRDRLDALLLDRAREVGARLVQPARVRAIAGAPGAFACDVERPGARFALRAPVVIAAHGSWERAPRFEGTAGHADDTGRPPGRAHDLFAFKSTWFDVALAAGVLPVLAFPGGYGGIVIADGGRATLACCIRRGALRACRMRYPKLPAALAVEAHVRASCGGVAAALQGARRQGPWLSVGPIRPGLRLSARGAPFAIGNAAAESHPIIGEGIGMALQSGVLLATRLQAHPPHALAGEVAERVRDGFASDWRRAFLRRSRLAAVYAHVAMHPRLAGLAGGALERWPALLTLAARLADKDAPPACAADRHERIANEHA